MLSVFEKLQQANSSAEIWWDSSPLDFAGWRTRMLIGAPDENIGRTWAAQLDRFMTGEDPERSLVRGITTNPSLIAKSIIEAPDVWAHEVREMILCQAEPNVESTFWLVYQEAVRRAAEVTLPMWRASNGRYGWVSGQLDPRYMFDTDRMMEQALQIARLAPNLMVKVPGTRQGYEVIRQLVGRGISINNTLSYTLPQFMACIRAVEAGRAEARCRGTDATPWRAVITDMIGRFGSNGDLSDEAAARGIDLSQTEIRWAEVAILKRIHRIIREKGYPVKMLLSSLSVDEPSRGTGSLSMHLEQTAGADIAYTCKPQFIADVMRRESEIDTFDRTAIDREIPAHVLEKLMKLPYFRRAFEPDGMSPEEFSSYGAFVTTYAEVIRSTRRLVDFVAYQFQTMSDQADRILVRAAK